ncbi:hypothetical protein CLU85_1601 [Acidovorax sp. 69]|uniref:hypothetical protein n=1 Tax=Acidovorax sp. 69 TaxID=2035202 RepID=UPI000CAE792D|nr:hypothetical protein [Acidovorax sp. 69]PJI96845.1 hypothetical protein CLU85_1601 [Acidovorax sp. 69]
MTSIKPPSHTQHRVTTRLLNALIAAIGAVVVVAAVATPKAAYSVEPTSKTIHKPTAQQTKKKGAVKIKHQRSTSEETTTERDRRLTRECKGAPNAGACLGYVRK